MSKELNLNLDRTTTGHPTAPARAARTTIVDRSVHNKRKIVDCGTMSKLGRSGLTGL
jgi:hypothetical protein